MDKTDKIDTIKVSEIDILNVLDKYTYKSKELLSLLKTTKCALFGGTCLYLIYKTLNYKNLWEVNDLDLMCISEESDKIIKLLSEEIRHINIIKNNINIFLKNNKKIDLHLINDKEIKLENLLPTIVISVTQNLLFFNNYTISIKNYNDIINKTFIIYTKYKYNNEKLNIKSKYFYLKDTYYSNKYKDRLSKITK